jgi:hypothetical protein
VDCLGTALGDALERYLMCDLDVLAAAGAGGTAPGEAVKEPAAEVEPQPG